MPRSAMRSKNVRQAGKSIVFEDLQWADTGLDFIDHLLDWSRGLPIMVVTLARPELFDRRADWATARRNLTSLTLEPLTDDAVRELLNGSCPGCRRVPWRWPGVIAGRDTWRWRTFEAIGDEELAGALAGHYVAAHEASDEGPEADAIAAQARIALGAAAERAAALGASDQAVAYLAAALAITTAPQDRAPLLDRAALAVLAAAGADALGYARAAVEVHARSSTRQFCCPARTRSAPGRTRRARARTLARSLFVRGRHREMSDASPPTSLPGRR